MVIPCSLGALGFEVGEDEADETVEPERETEEVRETERDTAPVLVPRGLDGVDDSLAPSVLPRGT